MSSLGHDMNYIGLDFETSGSDPWGTAVPIQIGIALDDSSYDPTFFMLYIGGWDWNETPWDEESEAVHKITKEVLSTAPPVWVVDIHAASWLIETLGSHSNRMNNIPVGWNVGGFDRQFVTRWMPNLNRVLSYRTLDLNSMVMAHAQDSLAAYKSIKGDAKAYANSILNVTEKRGRHDAAIDARAAILEMQWLWGLSNPRKESGREPSTPEAAELG